MPTSNKKEKKLPKYRSANGFPRVTPQTGGGKKITKDSEKDSCDIHKIMAEYMATGQVFHLQRSPGVYADVSELTDYRSALEQVEKADSLFKALSAKVRAKFGNSPAEFLDFVADPDNAEELEELGLLKEGSVVKPAVSEAGTGEAEAGGQAAESGASE